MTQQFGVTIQWRRVVAAVAGLDDDVIERIEVALREISENGRGCGSLALLSKPGSTAAADALIYDSTRVWLKRRQAEIRPFKRPYIAGRAHRL